MYAFSNLLSLFALNLFLIYVDVDANNADCSREKSFQLNSSNLLSQHTTDHQYTTDVMYSPQVTTVFESKETYAVGFELTRWVFTIVSSFSLLAALLLTIGVFPRFSVSLDEEIDGISGKHSSTVMTVKSRILYGLFLSFNAVLLLFWAFTSGIMIRYLQTFSIVGLRWSTADSSYLNAVLGVGQFIGSLTTIITSNWTSKYTMLSINVSLILWALGVILMILTGYDVLIAADMMVGTFLSGKNDYVFMYV